MYKNSEGRLIIGHTSKVLKRKETKEEKYIRKQREFEAQEKIKARRRELKFKKFYSQLDQKNKRVVIKLHKKKLKNSKVKLPPSLLRLKKF